MGSISPYIDARSAANVIEAQKHADEIGRSLNRLYTINTHHTAFEGDDVSASWQAFLQNRYVRTLRFYRKRNSGIGAPTYVWAIENKRGRLHIHWLMHMDGEFKAIFKKRIERWVTKEFGQIFDKSAALNGKSAQHPKGATNYLLKGMREGTAKIYGIRTEDAGVIRGKRVGHSRNIGPTAIIRYWKAREEPVYHNRRSGVA